MIKRKKIRERSVDLELDGMTIEQAIESLKDFAETHGYDCQIDTPYEVENHYGEFIDVDSFIWIMRDETDEEYNRRLELINGIGLISRLVKKFRKLINNKNFEGKMTVKTSFNKISIRYDLKDFSFVESFKPSEELYKRIEKIIDKYYAIESNTK